MPAPSQSALLPSLWEGLASKLGEVYSVGLGEITNFSPFWALSTDRTELGRIRPSKSGGWGDRGDPRAASTIAPRRDALLGETNLGYLGGVSSTES